MLSILIPTYNYSAYSLVEELYNQCVEAKTVFEIIVLDDGSTNFQIENSKINTFKNCCYEILRKNIGRSAIRNLLVQQAKYDWLLFLDADVIPVKKTFILDYISSIGSKYHAVFGGIVYNKKTPYQEFLLRWKYGSIREEINFLQRRKKPYKSALVSNLLIKKSIFETIKFDQLIINYGYEDMVFIENLKAHNYQINHIDNATFHLNYETSLVFLDKTKKSLATLLFIEKHNILGLFKTKIQKTYYLISIIKLNIFLSFLYKKFHHLAEKNLTSKNPSIFIFDLYKLCYFCLIKRK